MIKYPSKEKRALLSENLLSLVEKIPVTLIVFYGIWTVDCHLATIFKLPYSNLTFLFWKTFLITFFVVIFTEKERWKNNVNSSHSPQSPTTSNIIPFLFLLVFCAIFATIQTNYYPGTWGVLLLTALLIYFSILHSKKLAPPLLRRMDITPLSTLLGLVGISLFAIILTTITVRIDQDDAYYLSITTQALDHPQIATLSYESMYGLLESPMATLRRVHSYEVLVAIFSQITKIDHLVCYYIVFPAISCVLLITTYFVIFKKLLVTNRAALFGVCFTVLALFAWGDSHRTFGNFAFVRLFQGKTILVNIIIPFIVFLSWRFLITKKIGHLVTLVLSVCSATGLSINGILLAPLSILLVFTGTILAQPKEITKWKKNILLLAPCIYPLLIGILIKSNPGNSHILEHFGRNLSPNLPDTNHILGMVLGSNELNLRSAIALTCLLISPLAIAHYKYRKIVMGFVCACVLLLFYPGYPLHLFIAKNASSNFLWRLSWICPFPLFLGITAGSAANFGNNKKGGLLFLLLLTAFVLAPYNWTTSHDNGAYFSLQPHKMNMKHVSVAKGFIPYIPDKGLILAPEEIAVVMSGLKDHPPLIFVRRAYLGRLRPKPREDLELLHNAVRREINLSDIPNFISLVVLKDIHSIVFKRKNDINNKLRTQLIANGFQKKHIIKMYQLWTKE